MTSAAPGEPTDVEHPTGPTLPTAPGEDAPGRYDGAAPDLSAASGTRPPLVVHPLTGTPEVCPGDDLAALLWTTLAPLGLLPGDVVAVSSKVASKALGLVVADDGPAARQQQVLAQSRRVVAERATPTGVTRVVEALAGPVMVGAGIDGSNTGADGVLLLLPRDPDAVARDLHAGLAARAGHGDFGVVLTDTAGRPWRAGQTDFALGAHGLAVLDDLRGAVDADGRPLAVTARAVADEIAAAADLVKGKADAVPAALLRGLTLTGEPTGARSLVRTGPADWFALGGVEAVRAALGVEPGSALSEQIGLVATGPEAVPVRRERAARLALAALPDPPGWRVDGARVVVDASPEVRAHVAARLEVAAAAEGLVARTDRTTWAVTLDDSPTA